MDLNTENDMNNSDMNISQPSTTIKPSSRAGASSSSINTTDTRKSIRLSAKSSKQKVVPASQSNIHRTIGGGVSSGSPKLNVRRRTSGSTDNQGSSASSITHSTNTFDDNSNTQNNNSHSSSCGNLPSDQSDDSEMLSDDNIEVKQSSTGLLTRSQVYQCTKGADANLRKHLASSTHNIENVLFPSQLNQKPKLNQPTISSERINELHDAAISCIILDGHSFGLFRQPGMSEFLQTAIPGYRDPHRKTVRRNISRLYSLYTKKLRTFLSKVDLIALTTDVWRSSKRIYFISLTGHILTDAYESVPIVLGCRRIIGRHLASTIDRYLSFELNRLNITPDKIVSITTDNGSDIKKATSSYKFGNRISCMAHNLNLVVKQGLCLWQKPNQNDFPLVPVANSDEWEDIDGDHDDDNNDHASEIDENMDEAAALLMDEEDGDEDDDSHDDSSKNHNLNLNESGADECETDSDEDVSFSLLTINDGKPSSINHYDLLQSIFRLMKKTRVAISFIINHNVTNEYVIKNYKSKNPSKKFGGLVLDMVIPWNSSFLLLDRLIQHKDIIKSVFLFPNDFDGLTPPQKQKLHELTINQNEWELLVALKDVLEPFMIATNSLSIQNYPSMALSYYIWSTLSDILQTKQGDKPVTVALKESLRFRFNTYCICKLPKGQLDTMKIAAFLDPTIYPLLTEDEQKSAKALVSKALKKISFTNAVSSSSSTQTTTTTTDNVSNPLHKLAMLCGRNPLVSTSSTAKRPLSIDEEISKYTRATESATDFQQFWITHEKALPRLSRLVKRTLVTPATSISSEALFSVAAYLNRKQRSSLSSQTLRQLLVLKNCYLLDELDESL